MPSMPSPRPAPPRTARRSRRGRLLGLFLALGAAGGAVVATSPAAAASKAVLTGTVTSVEGEPVAGARVAALRQPVQGEAVAETSTDEEGRYELVIRKGLPGSFLIRVEAEGFEPVEGPVELQPGQDGTIDMELVPGGQAARQRAIDAYNAGVKAYGQGDLETATGQFEGAVEADPTLPEPHLGLAEISLRRERAAEAAEHLETYLGMRPDDVHARRLAYRAYRELGDEEAAERAKAALVERGAGGEIAGDVYNRGVEAYRAGDLQSALERFAEALELDPGLAEAGVAAAAIHYDEDRHEEAARRAGSVLEEHPENVRAARLRFLALEAMGSPEAEEALAAYAELDEEAVVGMLSDWAKEDFEADRRESARKHLERLLGLRPDLPEAHYRLGLVHAGAGETEEAKEHLGRFLELAPEHPEASAAREILEAL